MKKTGKVFRTGWLWGIVFVSTLMSKPLMAAQGSSLIPRTLDAPKFQYHPSPADWREVAIYQLITDRFFDGEPGNNQLSPDDTTFNPMSLDGRHGGDFAGITEKLDYIRDLGFSALWISPVYLNHRSAYHGYHILDFNRIDPHWGSLEDLRQLVDEAHRRGMYVILDVVFNHMARLLTSDDPDFPQFSPTPYPMRWTDPQQQFAPPFNHPDLFHGHGVIKDWNDPAQNVLGDLQGLADLKTENPEVRQWLLDSHLALIAATDCDGFRVDTAHHVELDFWKTIMPRLQEGAAQLGKTNFLIFGEALRHRDEDVSYLSREGGFSSMLYYPFFFTLHEVWSARGPTRLLSERWRHQVDYGPVARNQLITFADNHDRARLLNETYLDGDIRRAKGLLALLYASPGIPCIYYGTEAAFSGSKGHRAREPMFGQDGEDFFDPGHELANWIRRLNFIRQAYATLKHGDVDVLEESDQAGLFIFRRFFEDSELFVIANNSTSILVHTVHPHWVDASSGQPIGETIEPDTVTIAVNPDSYRAPPEDTPSLKTDRRPYAPTTRFKADGLLDQGAHVIASNQTVSLHAGFDPASRMIYLATPSAPSGHDRFIMVALHSSTGMVNAPWQKSGMVPAYDILISDEGDSDYSSVRGVQGPHWSMVGPQDVLESSFVIPPEIRQVLVRTSSYRTEDRGEMETSSVLPESPELYLKVTLDDIRVMPPAE